MSRAHEVGAGIAGVRVRRERQVGVEANDRAPGPPGDIYGAAVLVWMDLEMTGLDPSRHVIVEIATIVTDDELDVVGDGLDLVVHQPPEALAEMDDVVRDDAHVVGPPRRDRGVRRSRWRKRVNGRSRLIKSARSRARARFRCAATPSAPTAASSPPTSRRSRSTCTTGRSTCRRSRSWSAAGTPACSAAAPDKAGSHRALDDIVESIAELRYYREKVFRPSPS